MSTIPDNAEGRRRDRSWRRTWLVAAGVLGASFWAQLFWFPAATELLSSAPSARYLIAYAIPAPVLAGAFVAGRRVGTLFAVPMAFLPGLAMLPKPDVAGLLEPWRAGAAGGTLLAYLTVAALARSTEKAGGERVDEFEASASIDGVYSLYFAVRIGVLALLFAVLVGTPMFDAGLLEQIAQNHTENRRVARAFLLLFGFFTWCVVAYMMFLSPAANLEYDVRRVRRQLDDFVDGASSVRWRLAAWLAGGLGLGVVVVLVPSFGL